MVELSMPPDRNAPTGTSAIDWPPIARASASLELVQRFALVGDRIAEPAADHVAIRPVAGQAEPVLGLPSSGGSVSGWPRRSASTVRTQPGGSLKTRS